MGTKKLLDIHLKLIKFWALKFKYYESYVCVLLGPQKKVFSPSEGQRTSCIAKMLLSKLF